MEVGLWCDGKCFPLKVTSHGFKLGNQPLKNKCEDNATYQLSLSAPAKVGTLCIGFNLLCYFLH